MRIGAKTDEIDAALKKVGESAKTLQAGLAKLGDTEIGSKTRASAAELDKALKSVTDAQQRLADRSVLAARGLEALGGPAKLTRDQLDALAKSVEKGLDAFRALGKEAPADLQKVANALRAQQQALQQQTGQQAPTGGLFGKASDLLGSLGGLAPALTVGGLATAFTASAKAALAYADSLTKLSDQTKISTTALQTLEAIAVPSGNSLDQVATAVSRFQVNLSKGSQDTAKALNDIGLSLDGLKNLSPDEQFVEIAKGLQGIKDPAEQARIAVELFGKGGIEILPTLRANVDQLKDSTFKMSAESIKALDDLGDAFGRLKTNSLNFLGEIVGGLVSFVSNVGEAKKALDGLAQKPPPTSSTLLSGLFAEGGVQVDFQTQRQNELRQQVQQVPVPRLFSKAPLPTADAAEIERALQANGVFAEQEKRVAAAVAEANAALARQKALFANLSGANAARDLRELDQAFKNLSDEQRANPAVIDRVRAAYESLRGQIGNGALPADLEALRRPLASVDAQFRNLIVRIPQFNSQQQALENVLSGLTREGLIPADSAIDKFNKHLLTLGDIGQKPSGVIEEFRKEAEKAKPSVDTLSDDLDDLTRAFTKLAQLSDGSFRGLVQGLGQLVGAANLGLKAFDQLGKSLKDLSSGFSFKGLVNSLGSAFSLVGAGVSLIQSIAGLFSKPEWKKVVEDVGRDFGVSISEQTAKSIKQIESQIAQNVNASQGRLSPLGGAKASDFRQQATLLALPQIITEAGGVENFGIDKAIAKARDLFAILGTGTVTAQQVGKAFNDVFGQLVPNAINKTTGLASRSFVELIQLSRGQGRNGPAIEAPAVTDFVNGQLSQVQNGLQTFLNNAVVKTQSAATAVAGSIAAIFAEQERQGLPILTVLQQLDPVLQSFQAQLDKTGLVGGQAFDDIKTFAAIAKDEVAGPALQSVSGLQQALAGLSNSGLLTQDVFSGFSDQISQTFNDLVAQGQDGNRILRLMQPSLQTLFELQQQFGFAVDASTQSLLDQAQAEGIVGEQFKSQQQQVVDALGKTNDILSAIAKKLGADLPAAAAAGATGIKNALNGIPRNIDVDVNLNTPEIPDFTPAIVDGAATGGRVTPFGIQHFASGGKVLPFPFLQAPNAVDTVPAWLQPGEVVLNKRQQQIVGPDLIQAALKGAMPTQGTPQAFAAGGRVLPFRSLASTPLVAATAKAAQDGHGSSSLQSASIDDLIAALGAAFGSRPIVVQVDGETIVRAEQRVLDRSGSLLARQKSLLGVA